MVFKDKLKKRSEKAKKVKVLQKVSLYQVLLKPIFTEKSYKQSSDLNRYTFKVHKESNKVDVTSAIQKIYNVTPKKVNITTVVEKGRTNRKLVRKSYKKAIITLEKNDKIELIQS